jgi:hypothetical protein
MRTICSKEKYLKRSAFACSFMCVLLLSAPLSAQLINLQNGVKNNLKPSNGGTGLDTSSVTGCPKLTAGVWSFSLANCSNGALVPATGDVSGTYPNLTVRGVNGAAVPASAVVLASDLSSRLVGAAVQGNGTKVQLAAGTFTAAHLMDYDAGGNAIDSSVAVANVPLLNATNTFSARNTFSSEVDISSAANTGLFITPTLMFGASSNVLTFSINPTSGVAQFGKSTTGTFAITPTGVVAGANSAGGQTWSISNTNGTATFGASGGEHLFINPTPGLGVQSIGGIDSGGVTEWSIQNESGIASFKSLQVASKITNGAGMQVATGPGCTTAAAVLSVCVATITLSPVEPDNAYTVVGCTITPVNGIIGNIGAGATTSSFTLAEYAGTAAGATGGTISCLVVHN